MHAEGKSNRGPVINHCLLLTPPTESKSQVSCGEYSASCASMQ